MKTGNEQLFFIVDEVPAIWGVKKGSRMHLARRDMVSHKTLVTEALTSMHRVETKARIKTLSDQDERTDHIIHTSQCMKINRNNRYNC